MLKWPHENLLAWIQWSIWRERFLSTDHDVPTSHSSTKHQSLSAGSLGSSGSVEMSRSHAMGRSPSIYGKVSVDPSHWHILTSNNPRWGIKQAGVGQDTWRSGFKSWFFHKVTLGHLHALNLTYFTRLLRRQNRGERHIYCPQAPCMKGVLKSINRSTWGLLWWTVTIFKWVSSLLSVAKGRHNLTHTTI